MNDRPTYYIIKRIEEETNVDGKRLVPGYYRMTYGLDASDEQKSEYSKDREFGSWTPCGLFKNLAEFRDTFDKVDSPSMMTIERMEYVETVSYKGFSVPVFLDDYGQCFYCIFNNKELAFGTFQGEYEDEIRYLVDHEVRKPS